VSEKQTKEVKKETKMSNVEEDIRVAIWEEIQNDRGKKGLDPLSDVQMDDLVDEEVVKLMPKIFKKIKEKS